MAVNLDSWKKLIQSGEVVPIIGDGFSLYKDKDGKESSIYELLINEETGLVLNDGLLSSSVYEPNYSEIQTALNTIHETHQLNDRFEQLLSIETFKFFVSVGHDPHIIKALKQYRKAKSIGVVNLYNEYKNQQPLQQYVDPKIPDELKTEDRLKYYYHNVFQFFGPSLQNNDISSEAIAFHDFDKLELIPEIARKETNENSTFSTTISFLKRTLSGKSLLFLGCTYSHWNFVSTVLSICNEHVKAKLVIENFEIPESSKRVLDKWKCKFLTGEDDNYQKFLTSNSPYNGTVTKAKRPKIFISYISTDQELITVLANVLKDMGYDPWIDFEQLKGPNRKPGTNKELVIEGISAASFFMPVVTPELVRLAAEYETIIEKGENFRWSPSLETKFSIATEWSYVIQQGLDKGGKLKVVPIGMGIRQSDLNSVKRIYDVALKKGEFVHPDRNQLVLEGKNWFDLTFVEVYEHEQNRNKGYSLGEYLVERINNPIKLA